MFTTNNRTIEEFKDIDNDNSEISSLNSSHYESCNSNNGDLEDNAAELTSSTPTSPDDAQEAIQEAIQPPYSPNDDLEDKAAELAPSTPTSLDDEQKAIEEVIQPPPPPPPPPKSIKTILGYVNNPFLDELRKTMIDMLQSEQYHGIEHALNIEGIIGKNLELDLLLFKYAVKELNLKLINRLLEIPENVTAIAENSLQYMLLWKHRSQVTKLLLKFAVIREAFRNLDIKFIKVYNDINSDFMDIEFNHFNMGTPHSILNIIFDSESIDLRLERKENYEKVITNKQHVLEWACKIGDSNTLERLLEIKEIKEVAINNHQILLDAIELGRHEIVKILIGIKDNIHKNDNTALKKALLKNDPKMTALLIDIPEVANSWVYYPGRLEATWYANFSKKAKKADILFTMFKIPYFEKNWFELLRSSYSAGSAYSAGPTVDAKEMNVALGKFVLQELAAKKIFFYDDKFNEEAIAFIKEKYPKILKSEQKAVINAIQNIRAFRRYYPIFFTHLGKKLSNEINNKILSYCEIIPSLNLSASNYNFFSSLRKINIVEINKTPSLTNDDESKIDENVNLLSELKFLQKNKLSSFDYSQFDKEAKDFESMSIGNKKIFLQKWNTALGLFQIREPSEVCQIRGLTQITDVVVYFIKTYSNVIKKFIISGNDFASLPKKLFYLLNLEELDLSNNNLKNVSSALFSGGLYNLVSLNLSHNKLTVLDDKLFSYPNFSSLLEIDLSYNQLTDVSINVFGEEYLANSYDEDGFCSGRREEVLKFEAIKNIRWIDLSNNAITKCDKKLFFNQIKSLAELNLDNNPLEINADLESEVKQDHHSLSSTKSKASGIPTLGRSISYAPDWE